MEIKPDYNTALVFAYQSGAEKVANPGHEDCTLFGAQEGFAIYAGKKQFKELTKEQRQDFYREWHKGMEDERKSQQ